MRGKLTLHAVERRNDGLIPAHAGKTSSAFSKRLGKPAHPRACGENQMLRGLQFVVHGSSPRMRGKPPYSCSHTQLRRLIPAHAGKTARVHRVGLRRRAHPRACGENAVSVQRFNGALGSSPRMRGKLTTAGNRMGTGGLIPAHAGKTLSISLVRTGSRAHPRACGENY